MAIILAVEPLFTEGKINWIKVVFAACIAIGGRLSKSVNVTGTETQIETKVDTNVTPIITIPVEEKKE